MLFLSEEISSVSDSSSFGRLSASETACLKESACARIFYSNGEGSKSFKINGESVSNCGSEGYYSIKWSNNEDLPTKAPD
jgi:hypothetical protein